MSGQAMNPVVEAHCQQQKGFPRKLTQYPSSLLHTLRLYAKIQWSFKSCSFEGTMGKDKRKLTFWYILVCGK